MSFVAAPHTSETMSSVRCS